MLQISSLLYSIVFFNDTATTEIYTLSLHDALPISARHRHTRPDVQPWRLRQADRARRLGRADRRPAREAHARLRGDAGREDRKSTRLNSSHANISYAVFCLKKKHQSRKDLEYRRHH